MDTIISGVVAALSAGGLLLDSRNRQKFNEFEKTKQTNDHRLIEGIVTANEPIEETIKHDKTGAPNLIVKQVETKTKEHHTFITTKRVYDDGTRVFDLPVAETVRSWKNNDSNIYFAPEIRLNGFTLHFGKDTQYDWDHSRTQKNGSIKIFESSMENQRMRTAFGRGTVERNFSTKFLGSSEYVMDKVRSDYFGVSNATTGFLGTILVCSAGYFINNMMNQAKR